MVLESAQLGNEESAILDSIDRFLERDVKPYAHDFEARDAYPEEMVEKMKALGLFGATIGQAYGGPRAAFSHSASVGNR